MNGNEAPVNQADESLSDAFQQKMESLESQDFDEDEPEDPNAAQNAMITKLLTQQLLSDDADAMGVQSILDQHRRQRLKMEATYNAYVSTVKEESHRRLLAKGIGNTNIIESRTFRIIVYFAIILNAVQLGFQFDYPQYHTAYAVLDIACLAVFLGELCLKISILRFKYFKVSWNIFDFVLVAMSLINLAAEATIGKHAVVLRIFRMLRVVRVVRLLRVFRELYILTRGIFMSAQPIMWVVLLLVMLTYMTAIFACLAFEHSKYDYPGYSEWDERLSWEGMDFNPEQYFGTVLRACCTLFNLLLLTEWPEFSRAVFTKYPFLLLFFVAYIVFNTFGVMNILISIIVDNTIQMAGELKSETAALSEVRKLVIVSQLRSLIESIDADGSGDITLAELDEAVKDERISRLLSEVGFPADFEAKELFTLLSRDGENFITVEDFMCDAFRQIACERDPFQFHCLALSAISRLKKAVRECKEELLDAVKSSGSYKKTETPGVFSSPRSIANPNESPVLETHDGDTTSNKDTSLLQDELAALQAEIRFLYKQQELDSEEREVLQEGICKIQEEVRSLKGYPNLVKLPEPCLKLPVEENHLNPRSY